MMKKMILVWMVVGLSSGVAMAQVSVQKGAGKTSVDLSGLQISMDTAAREFLTVVQADIARSGWLGVGAAGAAEYAVTGQVQFDGASIRATIQLAERSAQRILFRKSYNAPSTGVRRIAHEAAGEIIKEITGRPSFANARLILVGTRTRNKELYISDSDGRGLYQVTNDKTVSLAPRWGHDGQSIFYTSYLRRFPAIYRIDLNSRARSRVANFAGLNASGAISPDGRDMALILSKDGNPDLYIMRLSDSRLTRITNTPRGVEATPAWSPDGRQLVYVSDQGGTPQLYIISRNGGPATPLTSGGRQNVSPDWGPHGEIVYSSLVGGKFQIFTINPQTRQSRQITSDFADYEDPTWAPNGRHLAAAKTVNHHSKVYLIDTMGDPPILLTEMDGDWYSPKWSR